MRKILLVGCLAATFCAGAAVLNPEAALQRAVGSQQIKTMSTVSSTLQLVYTQKAASEPAAYIFDRGTDAGYIIVSADDEAVPVLGYSDYGNIDVDNMPDGLRYWLGYYAAEIHTVRTEGHSDQLSTYSATSRDAIAPMLATLWNQGSPYNDKCPRVGTQATYTGCVATAMAQVMKYHNWPATGKGSNSYTWNDSTLSLDFSTVTFDWNNMLDTYGSDATDTQKDAVATLMYACGISVNMSYGTSASGAGSIYCGTALVNYFDYDASLRYLERDYYTLADWEDEVYASLADGCPVLYGGQSDSGGHEFVCDGYSSDGYFHFNWGWGGMSNGYFKLTALNPTDQGIGGAGSGAGYNFSQDIIVGIKPFAGQTAFTPSLVNKSDFTISQSQVDLGNAVTAAVEAYNLGYSALTFSLGLAIVDSEGNAIYEKWAYSNSLSLNPGYSYTNPVSYSVQIPADLADGEYTVTPAYQSDGKWYSMNTKVGNVGSVEMTVSDGVATFTTPADTLPEITDFSFANTIYSGLAYEVNGTISNTGDVEFYGAVYGMLTSSAGNTLLSKVQVDIEGGETAPFTYSGTMPSTVAAGDYQFCFVAATSSGYTPISSTIDITVNAAPASPELTLGAVTFESGSNRVPKNDLGVKTSLTCTSGVYYGTLDMVIFYRSSETMWSSCAEFPSEMLYLNAGDTKDIVYNSDFSNGTVGEQYLIMFYHDGTRFDTQEFIVLDSTTSVDDLTVSSQPVSVEIYNLSGQLITGRPNPGHYIMLKRLADGTASTEHLIIK